VLGDLQIRQQTGGTKILDDLMPWMVDNFPRHQQLYLLEDIERVLKTSTGLAFSRFLDQYVRGRDPRPCF
jgi:predicted metalloprotease with PDZ domain